MIYFPMLVNTVSNKLKRCLNSTYKLNLKRKILITGLIATLNGFNALADITIKVSPNADSKTTLADLKSDPKKSITLTQALAILKDASLRNEKGEPKENITLHLNSGIYRLTETLKIDATSSGSAEHPITIEGPKDASAIISGGRVMNGFTTVTNPAVLVRLPEVARSHVLQASLLSQGITDFGQYSKRGYGNAGNSTALDLIYHDQPMQLARWPNVGFVQIAKTPDGNMGRTFTVNGANVGMWKVENNPIATGYWFYYWADETIPIETIDDSTGIFTLTLSPSNYGIKPGQPIFFQNILAELDQPGEWYLDRKDGFLYFWPPQTLKEGDVEVSYIDKLLSIENANNIRISNITFENVRGNAITLNGGHHVVIANSIIRNIGKAGAVISGSQNGLSNMLIENTGDGGVSLSGGDRQTLSPANLYIENSTILNFSRFTRTYAPGIAVAGVGNRVQGNHIYNAPHAAIIFSGNDHSISQNDISEVCKETGDAGVIYTGRDWTGRGTVIFENHIHDIAPNVARGTTKGVYLDDQSSGIVVRGNTFENVAEAVFIGGGRDNLVENNKFINTPTAIHLDARGKSTKDDPKSTLRLRLAAVPYNATPYKERYPHLANILEDDPQSPKYNIARGNQLIGNSKFNIYKEAEAGISFEVTN
jgi:parallel beta-helix repeat protein